MVTISPVFEKAGPFFTAYSAKIVNIVTVINQETIKTVGMEKVKVARHSDLELSELILGFWRLKSLDANEVIQLINHALSLGITSIDEADIYGNYQSQTYLGRALKEQPSLRDKIQIISKGGIVLSGSRFSKSGIGYYDTSEKHLLQSVEQSLKDLHTGYLDLFLIHRPDMLMDPQVIDEAFQKLKQQGKVKHFGVSNFTPSQFELLSSQMETPLVTNQIEWSVLHHQPVYDGSLDSALIKGIRPMIWSPQGGGQLFTGNTPQQTEVRKVMMEIAEELGGIPLDQLALAWILKHPVKALPVIGTLKPERISSAVKSFEVKMSNEQWYRILIASQGAPMP
jgi:predicted oxidoreductase